MSKKKDYNKIINQIQKARSKNNVNWMNLLRLAFKLDPIKTAALMKKINYDDKKISNLLYSANLKLKYKYQLTVVIANLFF